MKNKQFQESVDHLLSCLAILSSTIESHIPQAKECLEGGDDPHPSQEPSREQATEVILRRIPDKIEEVMAAYDRIMKSINMPQFFKLYFDNR